MCGNKIKADKKVSTLVVLSPLSLTLMDYERGQESSLYKPIPSKYITQVDRFY
jgi:hypothetical protein